MELVVNQSKTNEALVLDRPRRMGDADFVCASTELAKKAINFECQYSLSDSIRSVLEHT